LHQVAILGAGNIGTRHLQGLATATEPLNIHVVDPDPESHDLARERWGVVDRPAHSVTYHRSTADIETNRLPLAIIATTAATRRSAFEDLVETVPVDAVLFEKVLFQNPADYDHVAEILKNRNIAAWVNTPRRLWGTYQTIYEQVDSDRLDLEVSGTGWGMACNAVHFIDLLGWFSGSGSTPIQWDTTYLEDRLIDSNRPGFKEFLGKLVGGQPGGNTISLRCYFGRSTNLNVRITTPNQRWTIAETAGVVTREFTHEEEWTTTLDPLDMSLQSDLTGSVAENILENGTCGLPTYTESTAAHLPFVRSLISHANKILDEEVESCPIT
jgi:hypothetical protein